MIITLELFDGSDMIIKNIIPECFCILPYGLMHFLILRKRESKQHGTGTKTEK